MAGRFSEGHRGIHATVLGTAVAMIAGGLSLGQPPTAGAVETRAIRDVSSTQFAQGETTGIEVLSEGRLLIAPTLERLERTTESVTWSVSTHPSTTTAYFSTGHAGKVYRSTGTGEPELWADLEEAQALSLAQDPTGGVFIGTAPSGKIYRVREAGKPELFFETKEKYVWSLMIEPTGALLAGTGTNGRVYRIWGKDNGSVIYKADQTNVMSVSLNGAGQVLLGLQGKAAVVRLDGPERGFVLWSGGEDEVRTVAVDPATGTIYAGVNSGRAGALADATANMADPSPPGVTMTTPGGASGPPRRPDDPSASGPSGPQSSSGSTLLRILPSGFASVVWNAPEGPIHSIIHCPDEQCVLVAAGRKGRVWRVNGKGTSSIIADSDQGLVTALAQQSGRLLLGTGNQAGLEVLTTTGTRTGIFQSRPLNAASTVRWGNLHLDLDPLGGTSVTVLVRSGNTADATARTWSDFTTATKQGSPVGGFQIYGTGSPVAQYLQYQLILGTDSQFRSPTVDGVQAFFLPQNAPPVIREIEFVRAAEIPALAGGLPGTPGPSTRSPQSTAVTGRTPGSGPGSTPLSASQDLALALGRMSGLNRPSAGGSDGGPADRPGGNNVVLTDNARRVIASWDASDPNSDRLRFRVRIKAEDEADWRLLEEDLSANTLLLATDTLPDGRYRVEVTATDGESNPPDSTMSASLVSRILTVDNSPPAIADLTGTLLPDGTIRITGTATDQTSTLAAGEFTVDASREPRLFLPTDGIFDSTSEVFSFIVRPTEKRPQHVITIRVFDREGNSTVGRVLVKGTPAP